MCRVVWCVCVCVCVCECVCVVWWCVCVCVCGGGVATWEGVRAGKAQFGVKQTYTCINVFTALSSKFQFLQGRLQPNITVIYC